MLFNWNVMGLFPSCLQWPSFMCYFRLWGTLLAFLITVCMWCLLCIMFPIFCIFLCTYYCCFMSSCWFLFHIGYIFLEMLNSLHKINSKEKNIVPLISRLQPNGDILLNVYVETVTLLMYIFQVNIYQIGI